MCNKVLSDSNNLSYDNENYRNFSQYISKRFEKGARFTGTNGDDINKYLDIYEIAAEDFNISSSQKYRYFHNLFEGEAKTFFLSNVKP